MSDDISVGDRVTWRSGGKPKSGPIPIGIANCLVKEFGTGPSGERCAKISHWLFKDNPDLGIQGSECWALVSDLEKE